MRLLLVTTSKGLLAEAEYWNENNTDISIRCNPIFFSDTWDVAVLPVENFILLKNTRRHTYRGLWLPYGPGYMLKNAWSRNILDYLKEPWDFDEMILRVTRNFTPQVSWYWENRKFILADELIIFNGTEMPLSPSECLILRALIQRQGLVVSRILLERELWGEEIKNHSRFLDITISALRKKIKHLVPDVVGNPILTVHKTGYTLP